MNLDQVSLELMSTKSKKIVAPNYHRCSMLVAGVRSSTVHTVAKFSLAPVVV